MTHAQLGDVLKTILTIIDNQDKLIDCFEKRLNDMETRIMQNEINAQTIMKKAIRNYVKEKIEYDFA